MKRAVRLTASTNRVITSAPAQAICTQLSNGLPANWYTTSGTAAISPLTSNVR